MKKAVKIWFVVLSVAMVAVFSVPRDVSAGETVGDAEDAYVSDKMGGDHAEYYYDFHCDDGIAGIATIADHWEAIDRVTVRCGGNEDWEVWVGSDSRHGSKALDQLQFVNCSPETSDDGRRVTGLKVHQVGEEGDLGIQAIQVHCSDGYSRTIGDLAPDEYGAEAEDTCATDTGSVNYLGLFWGDDFGKGDEGGIQGLEFHCSASAAPSK